MLVTYFIIYNNSRVIPIRKMLSELSRGESENELTCREWLVSDCMERWRVHAPTKMIWDRAIPTESCCPKQPEMNRWRVTSVSLTLVISIASLLVLTGCDETGREDQNAAPRTLSAPQDTSLSLAKRAINRQDLRSAETHLRDHLITHPDDLTAIEISGDVANALRKHGMSASFYREALELSDTANLALLDKFTRMQVARGQVFSAVDALTAFIDRFPDEPQARFDLVGLLNLIGLPERSIDSLRWLTKQGGGGLDSLLVLANPTRVEPDVQWCKEKLKQPDADRRLEYSLARFEALKLRWEHVIDRTDRILNRHTNFLPAYLLYGRALVETGQIERIPEWNRNVPDGVQHEAEYWSVVGNWAQLTGQHGLAVKSFLNVQTLAPTLYPTDLTALHQSLLHLGRPEDASIVAEQVNRFSRLRDNLKTFLERKADSQSAAIMVAESLADLGRLWEADGWCKLALTLSVDKIDDLRPRFESIRSRLKSETSWIASSHQLERLINLDGVDDQTIVGPKTPPQALPSSDANSSTAPFFDDQSRERNFIHTCELAPETKKEGHWIYQSVGGGVGIVDFDLDGFPDIAITMLDGAPLKTNSSPNRLFRNLGDRFNESGQLASYRDNGFSQGITVGDINEDGFPDIFDSNIGTNRLYINNGDGTFQETAVTRGLSDNSWTTSAMIADLDGDSIADLFATNYCAGLEPYQVPCQNRGRHSTCPPLQFEAERDRVWRGNGDGTFSDVSDVWLNQSTPGRGLGLVGGFFDERPGMDIYVANDMSVNHLWSPERREGHFRLSDIAAVRGVGLSGQSHSQASMGIATADADGDGDTDFFVTHFADDHNTFYEQVASGIWKDQSYLSQLGQPSMKLLGFGTEWADFDNNGTQELVVANGHVDNVYRSDVGFRMPAQLFYRQSDGKWVEHDRADLGDYFRRDHLGRALVTGDIDRDGRVDLIVTHLYEPSVLLINRSDPSGNSIGILLKSTQSQRDAIGASVKARIGNRDATFALTAGDGYMCSNQRRVSIGMGSHRQAQNVIVTWPSGFSQSFGNLEAGHDYLLVEDSDSAFQLEGHQ